MLFSSYGMVFLLLMNYIKKYFQRETKMKQLLKKILIILLFTINISMNFRKYVIIRICQQLYFSDTLFS